MSYDLFVELVKCSFLGGEWVINSEHYTLEPTILCKYDLVRSEPKFGSKSQMNRLFNEQVADDFKRTAKSELYRKKGGWVEKSTADCKVRQYTIGKEIFLIPILSKPAIGIDTSSDGKSTFICIAFFDNHDAGYHYLERFLNIPKSKTGRGQELKWHKLNTEYRRHVSDNLEPLLKISCSFVMIVKTNSLQSPSEKLMDVFIKLISGWFSNYDYKIEERKALQKRLFMRANHTPIHCDSDFHPLTPDKIVK